MNNIIHIARYTVAIWVFEFLYEGELRLKKSPGVRSTAATFVN